MSVKFVTPLKDKEVDGSFSKKAIFVLPDIFRKNTCIIVAKIVCNAKTTMLTKDSVCFLFTEYIEMNL